MNNWLTFLQSEPALPEIADELNGLAEFNSISFPSDPANDVFVLKCKLCDHLLNAELVSVQLRPNLLTPLIDEVKTAEDGAAKTNVINHPEQTAFVIRSLTEFNPDCDCTFRFHQVVGRNQYLWYTDGQFADEVTVWLTHKLSENSIAG